MKNQPVNGSGYISGFGKKWFSTWHEKFRFGEFFAEWKLHTFWALCSVEAIDFSLCAMLMTLRIWALWNGMVFSHMSDKCRASRLGINSCVPADCHRSSTALMRPYKPKQSAWRLLMVRSGIVTKIGSLTSLQSSVAYAWQPHDEHA